MKDLSAPGMTTAIRGASVILEDGLAETDVTLAGDRIAAIGDSAPADREIDGRGLVLAPAMVDVHGDAFERQVMPRPGVYFPQAQALMETDRQLAANGIATAYHALTLSWEPGLRATARGEEMIAALEGLAPRLSVENRLQLRWETFAFEAVPVIERALTGPLLPAIAFNDHVSMQMRDFDMPLQTRPFEHGPDYRAAHFDDPRLTARIAGSARRAGIEAGEYLYRLRQVWDRREEVVAMIRRIAAAGRSVRAPMLSHDDSQLAGRRFFRQLGSRISEFPMTPALAEAAHREGDAVILGAPNAMRGRSHLGSVSAGDMVEAGLCDALASDYSYPAMLAAVARLDAEKRADRAALWALVSSGPAAAMGLEDRGRIAPGLRADLVLVDWPAGGDPAIRCTIAGGRTAYLSEPRGQVRGSA
ncbi:alpha-D-ribose 1-methylphosphonate 5-triphosphate diphosphatase [Poseidonocella sp. HB161398]|uniref:alpha-D-ribose 1-methylphosphonate 5-triphosphate diphosphatase n=1 Tax=Poseidonocella sp. HB161398 TaxID=2320855 RepID=UPI001F10978E|nr:alpha-D-ribose 1-methylphosphonate 5-triphosphate diphosphatase [Poseidonocella sp. HB161398]